jgi:hypothetical protein
MIVQATLLMLCVGTAKLVLVYLENGDCARYTGFAKMQPKFSLLTDQ